MQAPLLRNPAQAAAVLGLARSSFYRLAPQLPPPVLVGRRRMWRTEDLLAWVSTLPKAEAAQ